MGLQQRLAKLEQTQIGDEGAGVIGIREVDHDTGARPDAVRVAATGETLTVAVFGARYPRGILIARVRYGKAQPT